MIKFFRKIRQNLLSEGKTGKYFKYAVGEIVLVVIGILIALSINNWNQNRLESMEEIMVLKSMRTDFLQTKKRANKTILKESEVIDYCGKMMRLMIKKSEESHSDSIADYLFSGTLSYWRIEPVNGTYDALIGSGKTGVIQNQNLNRLLAEYSAEVKYGFEDENYSIDLNSMLTESCSPYSAFLLDDKRLLRTAGLNTAFSDTQRNKAVLKHLNNDIFLSILYEKIVIEKYRLEYQQSILNYVENILTQIESELKLKKGEQPTDD